jgi:hypothetical protein
MLGARNLPVRPSGGQHFLFCRERHTKPERQNNLFDYRFLLASDGAMSSAGSRVGTLKLRDVLGAMTSCRMCLSNSLAGLFVVVL